MKLQKRALDLAYKICANVGVQNYNNHVADVQRIILASFVGVYIKARSDELNKEEYDPAAQGNDIILNP